MTWWRNIAQSITETSRTEIGELIFSRNSTLFETLDTLDVIDINAKVERLDADLNSYGEQLRQLAIIVDQNQAYNNARFVDINTDLNEFRRELYDNNQKIAELTRTVDSFQSDISELQAETTSNSSNIKQLQKELARLDRTVNFLFEAIEIFSEELQETSDLTKKLENWRWSPQTLPGFMVVRNRYGVSAYFSLISEENNNLVSYDMNFNDYSDGTPIYFGRTYTISLFPPNQPGERCECHFSLTQNSARPKLGYIVPLGADVILQVKRGVTTYLYRGIVTYNDKNKTYDNEPNNDN